MDRSSWILKTLISIGLCSSFLVAISACQSQKKAPVESQEASTQSSNGLCMPWTPGQILIKASASKKAWDTCIASNKDKPDFRWQTCDAQRQKDICDIWDESASCMGAGGQTAGMTSDRQATQSQSTGEAAASDCMNEPRGFSNAYNKDEAHVCFYTEANQKGEEFCSNGGQIPNLPKNFRYSISSMVFHSPSPSESLDVHLFSKTGYRGQERVLKAEGKSTLNDFNDMAASIVIDRVKRVSPDNCERNYYRDGKCSDKL